MAIENRGISKSILHFILHFILHSTILYSTLYSTQQFGQDVDVIDNFDINWSSKWLWPIIFSVREIIQYMHVTCNIWHMTERLPSHNFDWFALLEIGFVPADIWISWFGPFAFVKPICVFWSWSAGFLPKQVLYFPCPIIHIFGQVTSTFVRVPCMVGYSLLRQIAEAIL